MKCILSNSVWYSPTDFESLGGKLSPGTGKGLSCMKILNLAYFSFLLVFLLIRITPLPCTSSPGTGFSVNTSLNFDSCRTGPTLINSTLAFIKAYRLKGDTFGLKQAVLSSFVTVCLSDAKENSEIGEEAGKMIESFVSGEIIWME